MTQFVILLSEGPTNAELRSAALFAAGVLVAAWAGMSLFCAVCLRLTHRRDLKKARLMSAQTIAEIDKTESETEFDSSDHSMNVKTYADYHFVYNGVSYKGYYEEIGPFGSREQIVVFFNPENPKESMSKYHRDIATGRYGLKIGGIIFGVLLLLPAAWILLKAFLR